MKFEQTLVAQYVQNPDERMQELIERVGESVFGIRTQRRAQGNVLQDLLGSLLGGGQ